MTRWALPNCCASRCICTVTICSSRCKHRAPRTFENDYTSVSLPAAHHTTKTATRTSGELKKRRKCKYRISAHMDGRTILLVPCLSHYNIQLQYSRRDAQG